MERVAFELLLKYYKLKLSRGGAGNTDKVNYKAERTALTSQSIKWASRALMELFHINLFSDLLQHLFAVGLSYTLTFLCVLMQNTISSVNAILYFL